MENEAVVREHVESMKIPGSTGRDILDAISIVEEYLKNQAEIARINTEADAAETGVKAQMQHMEDEIYRKKRELDDEISRDNKVLNELLTSVKNTRTQNLKPLFEHAHQVKRIISLLRIAEIIQPVKDIEDGEITTYNGELLEWLEHVYKDDFLKIRLLITENRKPKNKYSLIAYGRCAFEDEKILKHLYSYGTPNLKDDHGRFSVRIELGCFPSIDEIKKTVSKHSDKILKPYIAEFEALKQDYLEVTGKYKLLDFEQITAQEKAKEGSK